MCVSYHPVLGPCVWGKYWSGKSLKGHCKVTFKWCGNAELQNSSKKKILTSQHNTGILPACVSCIDQCINPNSSSSATSFRIKVQLFVVWNLLGQLQQDGKFPSHYSVFTHSVLGSGGCQQQFKVEHIYWLWLTCSFKNNPIENIWFVMLNFFLEEKGYRELSFTINLNEILNMWNCIFV